MNGSVKIIADATDIPRAIYQCPVDSEIMDSVASCHNHPVTALLDSLDMTYPARHTKPQASHVYNAVR